MAYYSLLINLSILCKFKFYIFNNNVKESKIRICVCKLWLFSAIADDFRGKMSVKSVYGN